MGYPETFNKAMNFILKWEGSEYTNDPLDLGGETKYGITKNDTNIPIKDLTKEQAIDIYYKKYWNVIQVTELYSELEIIFLDTAVNFGVSGLWTFVQEALGLKLTGVMTKALRNRIDHEDGQNHIVFARKLINGRIAYRHKRVKEAPKQEVFLEGWLNRDYALAEFTGIKLDIPSQLSAIETLRVLGNQIFEPDKSEKPLIDKVREGIAKEVIKIVAGEMPKSGEDLNLENYGENNGDKPNKYLAYLGLLPGQAWCMAFVQWCYGQVLDRLHANFIEKTGYCPTLESWAKEKGIWITDNYFEGDILLFHFTDDLPDHTGFYLKDLNDAYLQSIEGNTQPEIGDITGGGVFVRQREKEITTGVNWKSLIYGEEIVIQKDGKDLCQGIKIQDRVYIPIRLVAEALKLSVVYVDQTGKVFIQNKEVNTYFGVDENRWGYIREIPGKIGIEWFEKENKINLTNL